MTDDRELILLTGATGYVGGRLLSQLEKENRRVRCLARRPEFLEPRVAAQTEVVKGDVLDPSSVAGPLEGVDVAYYLVHSMGSTGEFVEQDRVAAEQFAKAAKAAGVRRLVYLGGLGDEGDLSDHLASRQEVGKVLRESGVPTIEFRASIVIGSGSLSFEMIRALVEKLPAMITPRWVRSRAQPIGIEDVISFLMKAIDFETTESRIFEIGGADQASYGDIMTEYAKQRGLRRWIIPVPILSARLSSLWLGLVTPLYARVGRKLVDSLRHDTVVKDDSVNEILGVSPLGLSAAIERALQNEDHEFAQTRWSDALSSSGAEKRWGGVKFGSRLVDSRVLTVACSPEEAFRPVRRIGGNTGWYYGNWLWKIRGFLDRLAGGPGLRRGRRHPDDLRPGDTVDFWRVERFEPGRVLTLYAEMKVPGRAWLQFEVEPCEEGSRVRQTAIFDPVGLSALMYWYSLYPVHEFVFSGMLKSLANSALDEKERERERSELTAPRLDQ
ncbi:MAG: SDR family oxidoreductase [Planctomycetota bacterium]